MPSFTLYLLTQYFGQNFSQQIHLKQRFEIVYVVTALIVFIFIFVENLSCYVKPILYHKYHDVMFGKNDNLRTSIVKIRNLLWNK